MLTGKSEVSRKNSPKQILKQFNGHIIKIDYFDKKGSKNLEKIIPLQYIFNPDAKLSN